MKRTKRVAATVATGVLATAVGAASFLVSDQMKTTKADASGPLRGPDVSRTTTTAAPATSPSTSDSPAASAPQSQPAPDRIWAAAPRPAAMEPQPASTYDAPDTPDTAAQEPADDQPATTTAPAAPVTAAPTTTTSAPTTTQGRPQFVKPAEGTFTSGFGMRGGAFHYGVDIANRMGTPERAVADGTVIQAGPASGFGLWVRIRHDDGTVTVYGHMDRILVSQGQRVVAGQQIATMGARGQATGPHLHFEVWAGGSQSNKINPLPWLAARGIRL